MRSIIKKIVPPLLFDVKNYFTRGKDVIFFKGEFNNWEEALRHSTGYDSKLILEKCKASLLKIKNGEAVSERDGVLLNKIEYSWGVLSGLQKAAIENGNILCVLDFGGSLGSSYFQNRSFLKKVSKIDWCIVEQSHFVDCGNEEFSSEQLHFFYTVEECLKQYKPNILLLSSVLQYLDQPFNWLEKLIDLEIDYILIDRTAFIDNGPDLLTVQQVSEPIYEASYPMWVFQREHFLSFFKNRYTLVGEFPTLDLKIHINEKIGIYSGLLFEKKDIHINR
jgi:putative methyltransferase (TIGR04325 family)